MKAISEMQSKSLFGMPQVLVASQNHWPRWLGCMVIVLASSGLWIMLSRAAFGLH